MRLLIFLLLKFVYRMKGINSINKFLLFSGGQTREILRRFGAKIDNNCDIHSPLILHNTYRDYSNLSIGRNCHIGKNVFLDLKDKIDIESNITISMGVTILTHTSTVPTSPLRKNKLPYSQSSVEIKNGAYIGANATILEGVTIGEEAIVAAGSVVTKDVSSSSIVAGIPAKPV
jgi:acetyltransferase-like isoleucine patch superfamily enzyme